MAPHFLHVLSGANLLVLFLGSAVGLFLGSLPGLSPSMAVALVIPFTFHMSPLTGLILLGALYTSTVAGGAISAVLINIPGAPANIATALDGHAMAQQGRAREALHYCFISSFIGGVLGVMVLIGLSPLLSEAVLWLGPPEMFWIAMLGVTVIGSLVRGSVVRGLFAGAMGLWLATIGYDPVVGEERFVFTAHLTDGVNAVAALIGLFAIPQVLTLLESARNADPRPRFDTPPQSLRSSIKAVFQHSKALTIGSISGIVVGLIPGAGGQIAGLVAYDQTRKFSGRRYGRFGHGEPAGLISAEAANSAMVGPSLVPLLVLGVPGSPTAAVLLGGLLIHGLFPGPDLFNTHADTTWTFICSLLVAQLFMLAIGLIISRYSLHLRSIPNHYMAAAVTVLAVFGAYSLQNSYSDVLVMMVLGILMYFGAKAGFPSGPVALGLILGRIAETNFLQGRLIAHSGPGMLRCFFTGWLNLGLIALCVFSVAYSAFHELRMRQQPKEPG